METVLRHFFHACVSNSAWQSNVDCGQLMWLGGLQVQEALRGLVDQPVMLRLARAMEGPAQQLRLPQVACNDDDDSWPTVCSCCSLFRPFLESPSFDS
jgi:hypothetical protein